MADQQPPFPVAHLYRPKAVTRVCIIGFIIIGLGLLAPLIPSARGNFKTSELIIDCLILILYGIGLLGFWRMQNWGGYFIVVAMLLYSGYLAVSLYPFAGKNDFKTFGESFILPIFLLIFGIGSQKAAKERSLTEADAATRNLEAGLALTTSPILRLFYIKDALKNPITRWPTIIIWTIVLLLMILAVIRFLHFLMIIQ